MATLVDTIKPNDSTDKKVTITINQINIFATMNYKDVDPICSLCRKHLMAPTQDDLSKGVIACKISLGKCKHAFHSDCINTLAKNGNTSCPIDYTPWNLEKELDSNNKWKQYPTDETETMRIKPETVVEKAPVINSTGMLSKPNFFEVHPTIYSNNKVVGKLENF